MNTLAPEFAFGGEEEDDQKLRDFAPGRAAFSLGIFAPGCPGGGAKARANRVLRFYMALNHLLASVMQKIEMRAKEEIAAKLRETWVNYPPEKITKAFAVLQTVFDAKDVQSVFDADDRGLLR